MSKPWRPLPRSSGPQIRRGPGTALDLVEVLVTKMTHDGLLNQPTEVK